MPLEIIRHDITLMRTDAIVNAANPALQMGRGVCGSIFRAAGEAELRQACDAIGGCETGKAVLTDGYALPARYIIHAVGPVWRGGGSGEEELLRSCYLHALTLAQKKGLTSIAFPLLSSGLFGYPKDEALRVATRAIGDFLANSDMLVYMVVFDRESYRIGAKLFDSIAKYIDDRYVDEHAPRRRGTAISDRQYELESYAFASAPAAAPNLGDIVNELDESFSQKLLKLIDRKGRTDVDTYKRANLDRKLFSKIRSNKDYQPSKTTTLALAISLELDLEETQDLLGSAGYTLSRSRKFDVIIEYFIERGSCNIYEINEALFAFDQPLLGG